MTKWKCKFCCAGIILKDREQHLLDHHKASYQDEVNAYHKTQEIEAVYKKIFKKAV